MASRRVVITTFGSLGDLHPYLALGQELKRRGHRVDVATISLFRDRVEAAGLVYLPLRGTTVTGPTEEMIRGALHPRTGVEYILRTLVMPAIRLAYEDTVAAARGADLLVSHPLTFATQLVAEKLGIPWISTQLAPIGLLSVYDPPELPGLGWLRRLGAGPRIWRALFRLADWRTRRWLRPYNRLRAELGLPTGGNALFAGGHSPFGVLAMFSPLLVKRQPDWPGNVQVTGFPFYDQASEPDPVLADWMQAGPAPLLFTLGSSALLTPGKFFTESRKAALALGRRALLVGYVPEGPVNLAQEDTQRPRGGVVGGDDRVFATPYASYRDVFPRAAAIVHQGGIGTTAEALRAGRPMLIMPFGVDQPDNALRVGQMGVGRTLRKARYRAARVARELAALLSPAVQQRADEVGRAVRAEEGAASAAAAIEAVLQAR